MSDSTMPIEEAARAAEGALARIALLHIAFSKVLIEEHGREKGLDLIARAIIDYGKRIAERLQKGLPDLTNLGLNEESEVTEDGKLRVKGCTLAKVFKEQDALDVGHMYCYVDPAKTMAWNPGQKMIHLPSEACGDGECTVEVVPTTQKDRETFSSRTEAWRMVDPRLYEYDKGEPSLKKGATEDNRASRSSHHKGRRDG